MAFRRLTTQQPQQQQNENAFQPAKKRSVVALAPLAAVKAVDAKPGLQARGLRVRDTNVVQEDIKGKKEVKIVANAKPTAAAAATLVPISARPTEVPYTAPTELNMSDLLDSSSMAMDTTEDAQLQQLQQQQQIAEPAALAIKPLAAGIPDIDAEDAENPQLVAEYVHEIFAYLRELETKMAPAPGYMENVQKDLRADMRAILIDWLVEVHQRFKLIQETFYLTINILDRYLCLQPVTRSRLQLVGIASMLIASKYEEIFPPEVQDFVWVARSAYTRAEIISTEAQILKTLDFNLGCPLPLHFLRRFSRAGQADTDAHHIAKYLIEVAVSSYSMIKFLPSLISASALYVSRQIMNIAPAWDATLAHYAGYTEEQLAECVSNMHQCLLQAEKTQPAMHKKFATKKLLEASVRPEVTTFIQNIASMLNPSINMSIM